MNSKTFDQVVKEQFDICQNILNAKAKEYASEENGSNSSEDRLHNFKQAANMQNVPIKTALAGMMAKHTISIYDMCQNNEKEYSDELWLEKITDSINYLFLLKAVLAEEKGAKVTVPQQDEEELVYEPQPRADSMLQNHTLVRDRTTCGIVKFNLAHVAPCYVTEDFTIYEGFLDETVYRSQEDIAHCGIASVADFNLYLSKIVDGDIRTDMVAFSPDRNSIYFTRTDNCQPVYDISIVHTTSSGIIVRVERGEYNAKA